MIFLYKKHIFHLFFHNEIYHYKQRQAIALNFNVMGWRWKTFIIEPNIVSLRVDKVKLP